MKKVPQLETIGQSFRSWNIFGVALSYGCMISISNIFISWIPTYLVTVKGFATVKMGFLASVPFIGAVTGNMLGGWISDRFLGGRPQAHDDARRTRHHGHDVRADRCAQ